MFSTRSIFSAVLIALMLMTSASMASARGTMRDATGAMILCTGTGVVSVLIGADGAPIQPAHICPDCAMTPVWNAPSAFVLAQPIQTIAILQLERFQSRAVGSIPTDTAARDPPRI